MVGDHFSVLRLGTLELSAARADITLEALTNHMAGGAELAALKHELAQVGGVDVQALPDDAGTAPKTAAPDTADRTDRTNRTESTAPDSPASGTAEGKA